MTRLKDRVALVFRARRIGPGWRHGKASAHPITAVCLPVDGGLTARCA